MVPALLSGALLGLLNLGHCAGMCGPLVASGCGRSGRTGLLQYQLGRTLAYGFAGALAGQIGNGLQLYAQLRWASWAFTALAAIGCLFVARRLVNGNHVQLIQLRQGDRSKRGWLATLMRLVPRAPLPLGLLSVLLPCGLLAAALLAAVATGAATSGAALMLGFVSVSGIALFAAGFVVQRLPRTGPALRYGFACLLIAAACVLIARPIMAMGSASTTHTQHCH